MHPVKRFSLWGLTPQLFLFVVLPLTVLLVLVTFGGLALHQRAMRDLVGERDERTVRAAAAALTEQLEHRLSAVQTLGLSAAGAEPGRLEVLLAEAEHLLADFHLGLAVAGPGGELLAFRGDAGQWQTWAAAADAGLEQDGSARLLDVAPAAEDGSPVMLAVSPLPDGRAVLGAFDPTPLIEETLAEAIQPMEGSLMFVVDREGRSLYTYGEPIEDLPLEQHFGVAQALQGQTGAGYLPAQSREHVVAFSPVPRAGWALVIEEPWEMVTNPLLDLTENAPLVLVPVVLLAILALWFATQRIVQPLRTLEARASRLAWGDFGALEDPVGGIQEIRSLQEALSYMARRLRDAQQGLRDYIGAMTRGQEEERRRLARELHDDTLQALIALKQRAQLASLAAGDAPKDQGIAELEGLADQTIQNLRRLTRGLRPVYLEDLGLVTALEMLAREVEAGSPLQVTFQGSGAETRLGSTVELALYRIAQEALTNAVHHAGAGQAVLSIEFDENGVRLQVRDDGAGFQVPQSPAEFSHGGHFGLLGMYERAEMIGARLAVESQPGVGTKVTVELPQHALQLRT